MIPLRNTTAKGDNVAYQKPSKEVSQVRFQDTIKEECSQDANISFKTVIQENDECNTNQ